MPWPPSISSRSPTVRAALKLASLRSTWYRSSSALNKSTRSSELSRRSSSSFASARRPVALRPEIFEISSSNGLAPGTAAGRSSRAASTTSRITFTLGLPVEVRGKSFSGHTNHSRIRWYSDRDSFARCTIAPASPEGAPSRLRLGGPLAGSRKITTAQGSVLPARSIPTTTQSLTSGCRLNAASRSSGYTFMPAGVTRTSFLRPLK